MLQFVDAVYNFVLEAFSAIVVITFFLGILMMVTGIGGNLARKFNNWIEK